MSRKAAMETDDSMIASSKRMAAPRLPRSFVTALLVLGAGLSLTVVPGVFTIDETNYLVNVVALRHGHVTVANTAGLSPSPELAFFDPGAWSRTGDSTPVASTAPPLYAPIAIPFSWFGWRGLVALNTLAYLATIILVFVYARRYAADAATPWMAAGAVAFGGFFLEYAQGVWPHALSVALCTAAIVSAATVLEGTRGSAAATSGFLLALATGVRYQNAVVLAATGAAIVLWSPRRLHAILWFALAAALPLTASAAINYARIGSWNPISKGRDYLALPVLSDAAPDWGEPLVMFWARVVDFSVRPPLRGPLFPWVTYDPSTGAHLLLGEIPQKAFLQSAPWAVLAFVLFALAWFPRTPMPDARRRQVRLLSLITAAVIATFAFSGAHRHQGLTFNQRYLLELLPIAALGFAWALDGLTSRLRVFCAGALFGVLGAALVWLYVPPGTARVLAILKLPLLMASSLAVVWLRARSRPAWRSLLTAGAGMCLAWGLTAHIAGDLFGSAGMRAQNLVITEWLRASLPDHSAVVVYWGGKDAGGARTP
jgi:hypothetical protein